MESRGFFCEPVANPGEPRTGDALNERCRSTKLRIERQSRANEGLAARCGREVPRHRQGSERPLCKPRFDHALWRQGEARRELLAKQADGNDQVNACHDVSYPMRPRLDHLGKKSWIRVRIADGRIRSCKRRIENSINVNDDGHTPHYSRARRLVSKFLQHCPKCGRQGEERLSNRRNRRQH